MRLNDLVAHRMRSRIHEGTIVAVLGACALAASSPALAVPLSTPSKTATIRMRKRPRIDVNGFARARL